MLAATEKASYEVAMTEYRKKPKKEAVESEDEYVSFKVYVYMSIYIFGV